MLRSVSCLVWGIDESLILHLPTIFKPVINKTYNKNSVSSKDSDHPVHLPSMARVLVYPSLDRGWSGVAKVSCILHHWGILLILAFSWARPAILVAGKGRGGMFLFLHFFTFIPVTLSSLSLSFIFSTISSISFLPFSGWWHKMTHSGWCVIKPQHNQSLFG